MSGEGAPRLRVLDLFCGIGGLAAALERSGGGPFTVAAVDVNRVALGVYRHNFDHPTVPAVIESIRAERWRRWEADLWWMSPPCQPFTERGLGRDVDDPRSRAFRALLERVAEHRPRYLALENVPPFRGSRAHHELLETLERSGYREVRETLLCPTELGIPNRRRRFYLVAARDRLLPPVPAEPVRASRPLSSYLDPEPSPELFVEASVLSRYQGALHIVDASVPEAESHCFTSAYGRSPVRSGSYLAAGDGSGGVRRFSPREILQLLGFPRSFELPAELSLASAWRLVGNSLAVEAVRVVLATVPELGPALAERDGS